MNAPRADSRFPLVHLAAAALFLLATAPRASAQSDSGGLATVSVSALSAEDTSVAVAAGMGYRINRTLSVGVELTVIPDFSPGARELPVSIASTLVFPAPIVRVESKDGRATIFTGNLRLSVPTRSARISPYLVGGAGVGNVRDEVSFTIDYPPVFFGPTFPEIPIPLPRPVVPPFQESIRRSTTDVAITMGGGISFAMGSQWSIDGDARYVAIVGDRDLQMGRFGGGISYRF